MYAGSSYELCNDEALLGAPLRLRQRQKKMPPLRTMCVGLIRISIYIYIYTWHGCLFRCVRFVSRCLCMTFIHIYTCLRCGGGGLAVLLLHQVGAKNNRTHLVCLFVYCLLSLYLSLFNGIMYLLIYFSSVEAVRWNALFPCFLIISWTSGVRTPRPVYLFLAFLWQMKENRQKRQRAREGKKEVLIHAHVLSLFIIHSLLLSLVCLWLNFSFSLGFCRSAVLTHRHSTQTKKIHLSAHLLSIHLSRWHLHATPACTS